MTDPMKEFISEAEELLRETEDGLLDLRDALPGSPRPDTLNGVFRSMHTMKGLAGLFGQKGISDLSHGTETLLDELRLGKRPFDERTVAFLLSIVDFLKTLLGEVAGGKSEGTSVEEVLSEIAEFRTKGGVPEEPRGRVPGIPESISRVLSEYEEHRLRTGVAAGKGVFTVSVEFDLMAFEEELKSVTAKIGTLGELIATMPKSTKVEPGNLGFDLVVGTTRSREQMKELFKGATVEELVSPSGPKPAEAGQEAEPSGRQDPLLKSSSNTVRVDVSKLDAILNTVGELVLTKGAVARIGVEFLEDHGYSSHGADLQKVAKGLEKRLNELQNQILEVRMVPVGQIFSRLTRVVRRYTQDRGKEIDLQLYGEETEIDTLLAEEVIDPLMHLIRNAIDHGIEPFREREKTGKPQRGVVTLRAFPRGHHVVFQITDDGAGVQLDKVLKKAVEKGFVSAGAELDDPEVVKLIFEPGLSTASAVSEVSGRGVGMDVVKDKVSSLGGFVEVETEVGKGTTVTVTIPITLAIIKAILVSVAGETFAVPIVSTAETLLIDEGDIQHIEGKEVLELRGGLLPLVRLQKIFGLESVRRAEATYVVVTGFGGRRMGFVVDDLIGQQEIVIKALGRHLENLRGIAGAAEVGKHKIILVLDVEALMEEATSRTQKAPSGAG